MQKLYIKLRKEEFESLVKQAELHRRHPSAEAAELLARTLEKEAKEERPCPN